jgi:ABC-type arginine/histidine transport system permease subunit
MTTEERIQAIHDVMTDWSTYDGLWLRKALKSAIEDYDHEFVDMLLHRTVKSTITKLASKLTFNADHTLLRRLFP